MVLYVKGVDFMKRFLCVFMVLILALSTLVYADTGYTDKMQEALVSVKSRVDIPADLTEFTPYSNENRGSINYTFSWRNENGSSNAEIVADEKGRIKNYYTYNRNLKSDKKLTKLSKDDIITFANSFLQKALPEAFQNGNALVLRENSWNVNNLNYNLEFVRTYGGIEVKDNAVSLRIEVYDDKAYMRSMYANINYDAVFEEDGKAVSDCEDKYREAFPEELIYKDVYTPEQTHAPALVYRFKDSDAGFILASTGEVAKEDPRDFGGDEVFDTANKEMASGSGGAREEVLTEKELEEIGKVKNLISADEAYKLLKKLPYVKLDSSLKRESYNISQRNKKYTVSVSYANKNKDYSVFASFDGESGELLNLYARKYSGMAKSYEMTSAKQKTAEKNTEEFLKAVLGDKLSQFTLVRTDATGTNVNCDYDREVNSVRYINDGVYVSYDADSGMITSYSLDFEEQRTFANPEGVIDADTAYGRLMEISPLKKIYMKTGGSYKVCFTVSEYGREIEALTGEEDKPYPSQSGDEYTYSDIEKHWAREKIEKLSEVQIGFAGDEFRPNESASQADVLRLFAAGVRGRYYLDYSIDDLYRELIAEGILTEEEKNPERAITREEAFVYMIRLAGLDDVAKLSDIFKVEYEDGHLLSEGNIGYPAILTGMGVICGNGGRLRPKDSITRAESAVMVYNFMLK